MSSEPNGVHGGPDSRPVLKHSTTIEQAKFAAAAAAAVRPAPSPVVSVQGHRKVVSNKNSGWTRFKSSLFGTKKDDSSKVPSFNPELLTNQKRDWIYLQKYAACHKEVKEATSLFEHFVVVGLHPHADVKSTEAAYATRKARENDVDDDQPGYRGPSSSALEPQARLMERTPSMSDFNEVVYGQVVDNVTLYGVCLLVQEIVQRPPGILAMNMSNNAHVGTEPGGRFLVSAPRCYCILTQFPFFDLHFEVLNCIMAQERLERITFYMSELGAMMTPPTPKLSPRASSGDFKWLSTAISTDVLNPKDPPQVTPPGMQHLKPQSRNGSGEEERGTNGVGGAGAAADGGGGGGLERLDSLGSNASLERGGGSPGSPSGGEEDDYGAESVRRWAEANDNSSLSIICAYHSTPIPPRASSLLFHPLDHLQPVGFTRAPPVPLAVKGHQLDPPSLARCVYVGDPSSIPSALMSAEEADAVGPWAIATACRSLALENLLALLQGALLERQMVVFCPNLGVLSAVVVSLIPMIHPFVWQSVLLPILPTELMAFLDAPVPFLVGVQHKTPEVRAKSSGLTRINVYKDEVKFPTAMPPLPGYPELVAKLEGPYCKLAGEGDAKRRPVHKVTEDQAKYARKFLGILRTYLDSLTADLNLHAITDVRPGGERVSLLLKESYVASFPVKDRPFIKHFSETQLFAVQSDAILSTSEAAL